ncbi:MAG: ParB/RepB/Spo0J family partition protein [Spirochaetaceae bacterium]|nr:MAG: ParB/RepB/Spo0J family partition protein [Spirochaetaceae bacterium]
MSKRRLGKGIDALLEAGGEIPVGETPAGVLSAEIDRISPNPNQPRKTFNEDALNELTESVREKGVIQPIIVEKQDDGRYVIVAGERRFRAAKRAGLSSIPVIERTFTENEKLEIALIENIQRDDLNPIEEAEAYIALMNASGLTQDELSHRLGVNRSTIANTVRLLRLPDRMRLSVANGEISAGHARALLALDDNGAREALYQKIVDDGLSVREAESAVTAVQGAKPRASKPKLTGSAATTPRKSVELAALEEELVEALGTKVVINGTESRGKIEISFYSLDDLNRVGDAIKRSSAPK